MARVALLVFMISFSLLSREFEVMSYNVENLFDNKKDFGKDDWTFLPIGTKGKKSRCELIRYRRYRQECLETNWTEQKLQVKLNQIKRVIDARKKKPDFLAIIEIENEKVLKMLATRLGYQKWFITNSPDRRGIDVALMYNPRSDIKFISRSEFAIKGGSFVKYPTRNILEVVFKIQNRHTFVLYINHWPSLRAPSRVRVAVAKALKQMINKRLAKNQNIYVMAIGDFNTIARDHPHPFKSVLFKNNFLYDVQSLYRQEREVSIEQKRINPPGTYFFPPEMVWNHLDNILINYKLKNNHGLYADYHTYEIFNPKFITQTYYNARGGDLSDSKVSGIPWRYNLNAKLARKAGFSDHFPISIKVRY